MENDLLNFLSKTITEHSANPEKIIESACEYMEEHLDFGRLIINNNVDPLFPQRLFSLTALRETTLGNKINMQSEAMSEYLYNDVSVRRGNQRTLIYPDSQFNTLKSEIES